MTDETLTRPLTEVRLRASQLVVRHRDVPLVDVEDVQLESGAPLTVIGESGSGKSLLAHALMGTLPPELMVSGEMTIGAESFDLADRRGRQALWGRELALLPQEPMLALDPSMRVRHQVAEGAPGWKPRDASALEAADRRLGFVGMAESGPAYPHTLSGGMAQRVAYAAATIGGARILIVDEPTKGLDNASVDRLADLLTAHVEAGGLLLTITHDLRLALRLGGKVAVMKAATMVEFGVAEDVLTTPQHAYTQRLVDAQPSRWDFPWMDRTEVPDDRAPLILAEGISKSYAEQRVFDDISVAIRPGERWAFTGPSGAGKTTLGNALLRLTRLDAGVVTHSADATGRLQKLYQDPALSFPPRVPLRVALSDVIRRHGASPQQLTELLEQVGLPDDMLDRLPNQVSGGELQRIAIVRAMLTRPALIFADEATSRLDPATQKVTVDIMMSALSEAGGALLLITHDRDLAAAVADQRLELGGIQ